MNAADYIHALWGTHPPGLVQLWSGKTKRSVYLTPGDTRIDVDLTDLYAGVGLAPTDLGPMRRCKAQDIAGIAGLWLDIDIKPGGCPDMGAAMQLAHTLADPTLVVGSGGGIHVYHLLNNGPVAITNPDMRSKIAILADAWTLAHQTVAGANGWHIDPVQDLSRILRVPGTLNGKTNPPKPVEAVVTDGPRYSLYDLNQLCLTQVPAAQARHRQATAIAPIGGRSTSFRLDREPTIDPDLFADLASLVPEFAATWGRQRPEFNGDQSSYDASLAHWALEAGWTDQQTVDLMRKHRLGNPDTRRHKKAGRVDYYQRTLARAQRDAATAARRAEQQDRVARIKSLQGKSAA